MAAACLNPITPYEAERLQRIADNKKRLEEMGVVESARDLVKTIQTTRKPQPPRSKTPKARRCHVVRRSRRLSGTGPEYGEIKENEEAVTYSDYEPGLHDLLADEGDVSSWKEAKQEQFQENRCHSTGRGSIYDSVAGITCHFCRQKKLCGEEDCPRCSKRDTSKECIGKSDCSRCHSATGKFCRACLLIRYGQELQDVRKQMAEGAWLCPHCYEEEHPDEGWICNSSICMKRRGYKPTGIAIYDAQQRGFPSVAHWLQVQLKKHTSGVATQESARVDDCCAAGVGTPAPPAATTRSAPAASAPNTPGEPAATVASSRARSSSRLAGKENASADVKPGRENVKQGNALKEDVANVLTSTKDTVLIPAKTLGKPPKTPAKSPKRPAEPEINTPCGQEREGMARRSLRARMTAA
eukprot:jgi/Chrzof1/7341/Cz02g20090.t1